MFNSFVVLLVLKSDIKTLRIKHTQLIDKLIRVSKICPTLLRYEFKDFRTFKLFAQYSDAHTRHDINFKWHWIFHEWFLSNTHFGVCSRARGEDSRTIPPPLPYTVKYQKPRFQELQIPIDPIRVATWLPENDPHQHIEIVTCKLRNNEHEKRLILRYQHELPTLGDTIMLHYFWRATYWVHSAHQIYPQVL